MKIKILLLVLFTIIIGFISYKTTFALFSSSAGSTNNVFSASSQFPVTPTPTPTLADHLVINEILYDTSNNQDIPGQGGSNRGEFVEIYNPTSVDININGWLLDDNSETETLPNITIPANSYLIITGGSETEFEAIWTVPDSTRYYQAPDGTVGNGFNNAGDRVRLRNSSGDIIDQVSWGGDTTYLNPAPPDISTGHSLERNPDGFDTNTNTDFIDQNPPTPGT